MEYAIRLRKIREAQKLSQAEVAYRANISPSAYGQIERKAGNASVLTMSKIAIALDVSLPFLLDIQNPEIEEKTS